MYNTRDSHRFTPSSFKFGNKNKRIKFRMNGASMEDMVDLNVMMNKSNFEKEENWRKLKDYLMLELRNINTQFNRLKELISNKNLQEAHMNINKNINEAKKIQQEIKRSKAFFPDKYYLIEPFLETKALRWYLDYKPKGGGGGGKEKPHQQRQAQAEALKSYFGKRKIHIGKRGGRYVIRKCHKTGKMKKVYLNKTRNRYGKRKCKHLLNNKIKINLSEPMFSSRAQAIAVAYKQVAKAHPKCRRVFKKK